MSCRITSAMATHRLQSMSAASVLSSLLALAARGGIRGWGVIAGGGVRGAQCWLLLWEPPGVRWQV